VFTHHIVDRACIGRCFSYDNFEPSTGQFRVRANPGNPFVMADMQSAGGAQVGDYVVRARDLPLSDIYQCDSSMTELCVRDLAVGDRTSSALRDSNWFWRYNATSLLVDVSLGPVMFVVVYAGRRLTAWRQPARS
jgi:hypothetical protein